MAPRCPRCDQELRAGARFCDACGSPLAEACADCGTELRGGAKFCDSCGARVAAEAPGPASPARERAPSDYTPSHLAERILRTKSALEGERKQVTVLFADVKGSLELAERVGAEAWHHILDRFFQLLSDGVHRFEGTVNQYTGDGIMALFGAPIAHEDHAQRACYAALHIREQVARYATELKREHGVIFSTRTGLHSGEVVVGKIGDDLRMDYTAQGQSVGLAQRMETLASPDTVYLTGATAQLVSGYFELEDLGEFNVKGVREPVAVHRLVGVGDATSRFDISRARGLTRFVGRDADLAELENALTSAQSGAGQVVGVVAEAGTGKSRLCFEFIERCRSRGITVNQGTAVAHGQNVPYLPMLQVFRGYYGIEERDDDRTVREKIAGRMLLLDDSFKDALPVLFEFFGAPDPERPVPRMDPDAKQRQIVGVLRRIVQGADPRAGAGNFISVIEDLHWLDAGSEALLEQWVEAVAGASSFLLLNFRPEYHADWMQKSYYRQLPLAPLGPDAIRELLDDLLGDDPSMRGLAETIHTHTGGNPFFTEEVVQSLIESGHLSGDRGDYRLGTPIERLEVPASVHSVLSARIDRLPEREKQVLQTAAVIGKEFDEAVLAAAIELPEAELRASLAILKAGEFVFELTLYPVAEYAFKHPLTQEVALGSQLAERRRRTHAAVARAIEANSAARLDEAAALLAHHYGEAAEPLLAASWHVRAAAWVGRTDPGESVRHMRRVLALTDDLADSDERVALRLDACGSLVAFAGWRVGLSRGAADALFAEAVELAERVGDRDLAITLRTGYGATLGLGGEPLRYLELEREAVGLITEATSRSAAATAHGPGMAYSALCVGRLQECMDHCRAAIALTEGHPDIGIDTVGFNVWGQSLQTLAEALAYSGRLVEGDAEMRRSVEVSRTHDMVEALGWALCGTVTIADLCGVSAPAAAADDALRDAIDSMRVSERSGSPFSVCFAHRAIGLAQLMRGAWDEARDALEQALQIALEKSGAEREAVILAALARAHLGTGDVPSALRCSERAVAAADARGTEVFGQEARLVHARLLLAESGANSARAVEALLEAVTEGVRSTGSRLFEPQILEVRARLAALRGEHAAAREAFAAAHDGYVATGASGHAERLAAELR